MLLVLGGLGVAGIVGHSWGGKKQSAAAPKARAAARFARIDSHTHISPDGVERALQIMESLDNPIATKKFQDYVKKLKDIDEIVTPAQH